MNGRVVLIAVVVFSFHGCQWPEDRAMSRVVTSQELVGPWELDATGLAGIHYAGYKSHLDRRDHTLVISDDGRCHIKTFLDAEARDFTPEYVDATCRWRLTGSLPQTLILKMDGRDKEFRFKLDDEPEGLVIWDYIDDPDQWKYVQFARAKTVA